MKRLLLLTLSLVGLAGFFTLAAYAQSAEEWNAKGKEAYSQNQYEESVKLYSKALQIDPAYHKALFNRGLANYRLSRWQEARADLSAAISVNPKDHEAVFYRGLSYFGEGKYTEAAAQFDKAAEMQPLPIYMFNAAVARFNNGLYHATVQQCKMALRSKPDEQTKALLDDLVVKSEERLKQDLERKVAAKRTVVQIEPEKKKPVKLVYKTFEGAPSIGPAGQSYNPGSGGGG